MRRLLVGVAMLLTPAALAQTPAVQAPTVQSAAQTPQVTQVQVPAPNVPAPEVILAQQPVGKWGAPSFWVSNDLLLLGREPGDNGNRKLAFWSRQAGVFSVDLPTDLEEASTPEGSSLCAKDGVLQWLASAPPRPSGIPYSTPTRQFIRLVVDPVAKTGRIEKGASEEIISASGYDRAINFNKTGAAQSGFHLVPRADCRLVNNVAAVEGLKRIPELFDVPSLYVYAASAGGYVASWGSGTTGPDGKWTYNPKYLLLDAAFRKVEPQPEKPFSLVFPEAATPFGKPATKDVSNAPDPMRYQIQITSADGKARAIATSGPDQTFSYELAPDGCAMRVRMVKTERPKPGEVSMITQVRPAPPPAPGTRYVPPPRLGTTGSGEDYSIIDLCSAESRKLLGAK